MQNNPMTALMAQSQKVLKKLKRGLMELLKQLNIKVFLQAF